MGYGNTANLERRFFVSCGSMGTDVDGNQINYVEGNLAAIYLYDDPGVPEKHIEARTKLAIELIDPQPNGIDARYTVYGAWDGKAGACSWFATTAADGLTGVAAGEAMRIKTRAATNNNKITFARIEVMKGGSWQVVKSETKWNEIEPIQRGEKTHELIHNHPAFVDKASVATQCPSGEIPEDDFDAMMGAVTEE